MRQSHRGHSSIGSSKMLRSLKTYGDSRSERVAFSRGLERDGSRGEERRGAWWRTSTLKTFVGSRPRISCMGFDDVFFSIAQTPKTISFREPIAGVRFDGLLLRARAFGSENGGRSGRPSLDAMSEADAPERRRTPEPLEGAPRRFCLGPTCSSWASSRPAGPRGGTSPKNTEVDPALHSELYMCRGALR